MKIQRSLIMAGTVLLLLPMTACESKQASNIQEAGPAEQAVAVNPETHDLQAADAETVDELQVTDVQVGTGEEAGKGDRVSVHYTGTLYPGGKKFDSSLDRKEPFTFTLGVGQVIRGWDEGVKGMKEGGKRILIIPSDMAYGPMGAPPDIPPNAPLKFEVELLEVH